MRAETVLKALKAHKGPVLVSVNLRNDNFNIKVAKSELLRRIGRLDDGEAEFEVVEDRFYFYAGFNGERE